MYKGTTLRLTVDFSSETMDGIKQWDEILKVLKEKKKLSFKNEGKMKHFHINKN